PNRSGRTGWVRWADRAVRSWRGRGACAAGRHRRARRRAGESVMRINRVHADAFGAMTGRTLELGPGLNVIVGPNESGKSTWHAALYAALCGVPPRANWTAADERFAAFREPRDGSGWAVRAEIEVAGPTGTRRVALSHDLLDPYASTAIDLDTGEDLSAEIDGDDGPDAARWVGFDRRGYAATSWIEQAGARSALVSVDG